MTKRKIAAALVVAALVSLGAAGTAFAQSDNNALIDVLVKKKILTKKEADAVRADMVKEDAQSEQNLISLSKGVKELRLYGDLRFREQYDNQHNISNSAANHQTRFRFRLRLNADITLQDGWFGGLQLQTNNAPDSANQTFGPAYQNYNIYISRAFAGWRNDWFTGVVGKQANPFYTPDLVWDPDINPEGLTERISIDKLLSGSTLEQAAGLAKDGKTAAAAPARLPWSLSLVAGQFLYADNKESNLAAAGNTDVWQFTQQLVGTYDFSPKIRLTVAPGYSTYNEGLVQLSQASGTNSQGFYNNTNPALGAVQKISVVRDLSIITVPGDLAFDLGGIRTALQWDFAYNTEARSRFTQVLSIPEAQRRGKDARSWMAGVSFGQNLRAGDWSLFANYRQVGIASIDPNLNDSDFALSYLNVEGVKIGVAYNITNSAIGQLTWFNACSMGGLRGGQATTNFKLANASSVQVVQVDFNVKF